MKLLCNVTRGETIESKHEVYAVAIDEEGKTIFSAGNQHFITCIRSSLKPFQASASILSGATKTAGFNKEEIALMCASHNGEKIHVKKVKGMAKKLKLKASDYECGCHAPYDLKSRNKAISTGLTPFHNNCSGKHTGMLALAKQLGTDITNYISYNHPVQRVIFKQLSKLTGKDKFVYGIDGCGAPTPFLSLIEIAKLFQLLAQKKFPELTVAYEAMATHPYLIAGKNRFDTDFNETMKGRGVTKVGGEAIRGMVIKTDKYGIVGIAQKILDGSQRANETAIMTILNHLNLLKPEEKASLINHEKKKLFNHRKTHIGYVEGVLGQHIKM